MSRKESFRSAGAAGWPEEAFAPALHRCAAEQDIGRLPTYGIAVGRFVESVSIVELHETGVVALHHSAEYHVPAIGLLFERKDPKILGDVR
jgi:hypothetical protein